MGHTAPRPYPGNTPFPPGAAEIVLMLEGDVTVRNGEAGDAGVFHFRAGDCYIVPKGMMYEWHSVGYTKKFVACFQPAGVRKVKASLAVLESRGFLETNDHSNSLPCILAVHP